MKNALKLVAAGVVAASLGLQILSAQTIRGTVRTYGDETPLSGAIVKVEGTSLQTVTDDQGRFHLANVEGANVTLSASYIGLGENSQSVALNQGSAGNVDFFLGEEVINLDPLIVQGAKIGQAKALNIQRAASGLTNIVASDAFGNFPDENAAEALQRISGVSIERDQGEGRYVVVRGIDPDLNNISMDGVALTAPESDTRKIALDVVPTELLERLEVRKTITPDMDGDAIGASINLKTISALDKGGEFASVKAQMLYNDLVDSYTPMVSFAYGDTFGERGDMGFMIAASYQEREFGSDNIEIDGPWGEEEAEDGTSAFFAPEIEFRQYEVTRERKAFSANFEKQFDDTSSFFIRTAYNYFSDQEFRSRTEIKTEDGTLESITSNSAVLTDVEEADRDLKDRFEEQEIYTISVGGETQVDNWNFGYRVSFAHAEENEPNRLDVDFRSEELYDVSYDFSDPFQPNLNVSNDSSVFQASNFLFDEAVVENNTAEEEETAFQIDVRRDVLFGNHPGYIKFGAKLREKEKKVDNEVEVYSNDSSDTTLADVLDPNSRFPFFRGSGNYLKADPTKVRQFFSSSMGDFEFESEDSEQDSNAADYVSNEDILALYGMAEVNIDQWTVVGGARLEDTDFSSVGNETIFDVEGDLAGFNSLTFDKNYDNVLAMLSARRDISDQTVLRMSWTNTIARPKFGDSAFRRERNIEDEEVISGNPDLDPYESMNFDISLEHYLDGLGQVSVSVFQKDIDSFIFVEESKITIDGEEFDFFRPLNGNSATITGLELGWQQDLGSFTPGLDGFGIYTNLTFTDSESTTDTRPGEELPFLKQSDTIANIAFTYENEKVFFRLAGTLRSEYLDAIAGESAEDEYVDEHFQLDAKAVYKINPHSSIFLDLINLNEEPFHAYYGVPTRMRQNEEYSWSAKLGFTWKR